MKSPNPNLVRSTGRGVLYIAVAKLWFMLTGWILVFGLPRIFKLAAGGDEAAGLALFGDYKIVIMGVSFINNGIITGTIQAVSKFTSENEHHAGAVRRTAVRIQGLLGAILALLYIGFADLLAQSLGSPDLALLMRVSAVIIVSYSFYAVFIGSFNGLRLFHRQALFDIVYATIKTGLIIGLAWAGFKVLGTVMGFLIASLIIAVAGALLARGEIQGSLSAKRYLAFAATLIGYTFVLNLVLSVDLFLLKGLSAKLSLSVGETAAAASETSKILAGRYGAAQGLAFIPYQAILAIAFVAFPMISKATFEQDLQKTQTYIQKTIRFTFILIVGLATVFAALPNQALALIFPNEYQVAADALGILSCGIVGFGMMMICNTILNSAGRPWHSLAVVGVALMVLCGAVSGMLMLANPMLPPLVATALGTTLGMLFGCAVAGWTVHRCFGALCPPKTIIRVVFAALLTIVLGRWLPLAGAMVTLAECVLVIVIYFAILIVLREINRQDLLQLQQVLRRRKAKELKKNG